MSPRGLMGLLKPPLGESGALMWAADRNVEESDLPFHNYN